MFKDVPRPDSIDRASPEHLLEGPFAVCDQAAVLMSDLSKLDLSGLIKVPIDSQVKGFLGTLESQSKIKKMPSQGSDSGHQTIMPAWTPTHTDSYFAQWTRQVASLENLNHRFITLLSLSKEILDHIQAGKSATSNEYTFMGLSMPYHMPLFSQTCVVLNQALKSYYKHTVVTQETLVTLTEIFAVMGNLIASMLDTFQSIRIEYVSSQDSKKQRFEDQFQLIVANRQNLPFLKAMIDASQDLNAKKMLNLVKKTSQLESVRIRTGSTIQKSRLSIRHYDWSTYWTAKKEGMEGSDAWLQLKLTEHATCMDKLSEVLSCIDEHWNQVITNPLKIEEALFAYTKL